MHTRQESNTPAISTKRRHSAAFKAFKRKILDLVEQPGASVTAVALEQGINANLVFKWLKAKLDRRRPPMPIHQPVLLPVSVHPQGSPLAVPTPKPERAARKEGVIQVEIGGARVLLRGSVDPFNVRSVLLALRDCA